MAMLCYRKEIAEGGEILKEKMLKYLPKIALFNGKGIYEVFCGHKNFNFGLQPDPFPGCPDTVSASGLYYRYNVFIFYCFTANSIKP